MGKPYIQLFGFFMLFAVTGFSQEHKSETSEGFFNEDSTNRKLDRPLIDDVYGYIQSIERNGYSGIFGGYIESIFHEKIDSAQVIITIEGNPVENLITEQGVFYFRHNHPGKLLDVHILHSDFHSYDTAFILPREEIFVTNFQLTPKYKILLRGRVFVGKVPLEGVNVNVLFEGKEFKLKTKGCYYDDEDYWNCLFDGMFKRDLIAENAADSIYIFLSREGMRPLSYGMRFNEYTGEVMQFKMEYTSALPYVPLNSLNLKLGFPILSSGRDWFVSLSYYRLLNENNLKRFGIGVEGNMFLSTISASHSTLPGRDITSFDSSYVFSFLGPSALIWLIKPERRYFSTYAGCTFAFKLDNGNFVPQPFIGSRIFLDINKAVSFEIRYAEFDTNITHYEFNLYGNANSYKVNDKFRNLNFSIGMQVVF